MDSDKGGRSAGMRAWRFLFGGDQVEGRGKLFVFLILFILVGGLIFGLLR